MYNYAKLIAGPIEKLKNKLAMDNKSFRWFHAEFIHPGMTYREFLEFINTREETNAVIERGMYVYDQLHTRGNSRDVNTDRKQ